MRRYVHSCPAVVKPIVAASFRAHTAPNTCSRLHGHWALRNTPGSMVTSSPRSTILAMFLEEQPNSVSFDVLMIPRWALNQKSIDRRHGADIAGLLMWVGGEP